MTEIDILNLLAAESNIVDPLCVNIFLDMDPGGGDSLPEEVNAGVPEGVRDGLPKAGGNGLPGGLAMSRDVNSLD